MVFRQTDYSKATELPMVVFTLVTGLRGECYKAQIKHEKEIEENETAENDISQKANEEEDAQGE